MMAGRGWPTNLGDSPIMGSHAEPDSGPALLLLSGVLAVPISGGLAILGALLTAYSVPDGPYGTAAVLFLSGFALILGIALLLRSPRKR
jgi:hypothetical protein